MCEVIRIGMDVKAGHICYTAAEAIAAAAKIGLKLVQPDRFTMRITDEKGREYSHWASGATLYLRCLD